MILLPPRTVARLHIAPDACHLRSLLANADRHTAAHTRITVANPGAEISPGDRKRLFQKYYRGANTQGRPGASLGLYLVQRIALQLGGSVDLRNAGGDRPVCFALCLPVQPPTVA